MNGHKKHVSHMEGVDGKDFFLLARSGTRNTQTHTRFSQVKQMF